MRASYEERDVYVAWLVRIAAGLAVVVVVVMGLCWGLARFWRAGEDPNDRGFSAALANQTVLAPANATDGHSPVGNLTHPAPATQGTQADMVETNARLHSFGWVNETRQTVHIPIEDAMHLIVLRHPPAVPPQGGNLAHPPAVPPQGGNLAHPPSVPPQGGNLKGDFHAKTVHAPATSDHPNVPPSPSPGPGLTPDSR